MTIKKGDFVKIDYTGKLKENNLVFDTTNKEIGKKEGFEKKSYEPVIIRIGDNQVIKGLDDALVGKELNKDYTIELIPDKAFGMKSAKLIQLVPLSRFSKENIRPMPGLQVQINEQIGIVKVVTGGRVMVDFNHPLSGKDVIYDFKILEIIEDNIEKIKAFFSMTYGIQNLEVKMFEKGYEIQTNNPMPDVIKEEFNQKLREVISDKQEYIFTSKKEENKIKKEEKKETTETNTIKE